MNSEKLYRFFKGELSEPEMAEIKAWVEEDPSNRKQFFAQRKMFDMINIVGGRKLNRGGKTTSRKTRVRFGIIGRIAAVLGIAFAASYVTMRVMNDDMALREQTITVPAGQRIDIVLPDGSKVCLNGRSSISYSMALGRKERSVKLDGQAYFDIKHMRKSPFVVTTPKGRVEVLGTKFDLMDFSDGESFEAALLEGTVKVSLLSDTGKEVVLTPEMKAVMVGDKLVKMYIDDHNPYMWRNGLISFREASFDEIMSEFKKNYDIDVVVRKEELKNVSYTGKFRTSDGIDYALRVLQRDVNFNYSRSEDHRTIYIY